MILALTGARASAVINCTNFPGNNLRQQLLDWYDNGDGVLSDEELANNWLFSAENANNTKGLELLTGLTSMGLAGVGAMATTINAAYLPPNLEDIHITWYDHMTSLDLSSPPKLVKIHCDQLPLLEKVKCPANMEQLTIYACPKLTRFDFNRYKKLGHIHVTGRDLQDIVIEGLPNLFSVLIEGFCEEEWNLGKVSVTGCESINNFDQRSTKVKSVEFSGFLTENVTLEYNEIDIIRHMTLRKLPVLYALNANNDQQQTLIVDECPSLWEIWTKNNRLMWLDLSNVKYDEDFVIYNDGPSIASLVGAEDTGYRYNTDWPYPWISDSEYGNTRDNLLPVTLKVTGWTKHPAFIRLVETDLQTPVSSATALWNEPLTAPEVIRSQDYDGKLTFSLSNESVVKVDAETGTLTPVAPGRATTTVAGTETDYRQAPPSVSYTVFSKRQGDVNIDG